MQYKLKNVDCAACASNIEAGLRKNRKHNEVSVNTMNNILTINANDIAALEKEIKKIEPGVSIERVNSGSNKSNQPPRAKRELIKIFLVILLFSAGMLFETELHNTNPLLEFLVFISAYLISGWGVISKAVKNLVRGKVFDENFLMTIATAGAILIHALPEAVAVMWFYIVGEFVEGLAVRRSRKSIKTLLEIRPDTASVNRNGKTEIVSPEEVTVGEIIIIKPGEKIPLDGEVIEGSSFVDTYPVTGESVPKKFETGEMVYAGTINKTGVLRVEVRKPFGESSITKILELVENASSKKAETEKFITRFARYYTPVVVFIALGIALIPPLVSSAATFSEWIYRALVILVISCPCALVISIPLGFFGGVGGASRRGILVKGSNYLEALSRIKTIVFDKTGTLTKGVFKVTEINPVNGYSKDELLKVAAYAEHHSPHPIAKSIIEAYNKEINENQISEYEELSGRGIKARIDGHEVIAGNDRVLHEKNIEHPVCKIEGTVVHVAVGNVYAGYIVISDELKDEAPESISLLKKGGIEDIKIFSGDNENSTKTIAEKLHLNNYKAELLPENKMEELEKLIDKSGKKNKIAFVGDGINDAPVLARADVGIAMGALGSDAAIESADVVIMADDLMKIPEAVRISKRTRNIVIQNIVFALGIKGIFILFGSFGLAGMWEAVFADMGVALIAILNATRVLRG
jgi:Cd2+/Zn2+-exporting ATPase